MTEIVWIDLPEVLAIHARQEAQKTFRRLKAYRQLPILRNALQEHLRKVRPTVPLKPS